MSIDERHYGAYPSGSGARRLGLFDDEDADRDLVGGGLAGGGLAGGDLAGERADRGYAAERRYPRASRDTTTPARRASARPRAAAPAPRRAPAPRPRRGRGAWVGPAGERLAAAPAAAGPVLRLPRVSFVLLITSLVVTGAVGVLVLNTKINENSFRLGDLKQTQAALSLQEQQLEQQLADLSSPGNLRAAATRLGLVPAGTPVYLQLPDGREVSVPQPGTGEPTADR